MSRRAEAGVDVPVYTMFSILLKFLKELIYTHRFFSNTVLEICPLNQSLPARAAVTPACCMRTFLQAETSALPHRWLQDTVLGIYSLYLYFHYRRT